MNRILSGVLPSWLYIKLLAAIQGEDNRTLVKGASSAFIIKIFGAGLNFGTQVFLARILGVKEYGFFAYATSWMILLSIPARLGLRESLIRFIPQYEVENRPDLARGILGAGTFFPLIASMVIACLFWLFISLEPDFWSREQITVMGIMVFVVPAFTLNGIREASLRSFKKIFHAFAPEQIVRPILLCALSAFIFYCYGELTVRQAWICNGASYFIAFFLGTWWLYKALPEHIKSVVPKSQPKHWIVVSFPMLLMGGMNVFLNQSSVVFLGLFSFPKEVGIYAATARLILLTNFALASVNAIAGPMIAKLYYSDQHAELQKMLTNAARGTFLFTIVIAIFFCLFGKNILAVFGDEFVKGYTPLLILLSGQLVNSFAGSVALILNITGHQNNAAKILGVAVIGNILSNLVFIPWLGACGAAVANTFSVIVWNLLMLKYVRGILNLNPSIIKFRRGEKQNVERED